MKTSEASKIVTAIVNRVIGDIFDKLNEEKRDASEKVGIVKGNESKDDTNWTCPICRIVIKHRQNIGRHKAICPKLNVLNVPKPKVIKQPTTDFHCEYCLAKFSLQKSLKAHTRRNHLEQFCLQYQSTLFKCSDCDFQSTGDKYLKIHVKKFHSEKGNFSCDVCDKRFANKDSLRVHKRTHLAIRRSYVCEVCGCIIVADADQDNHVCVSPQA